VLLPAQGCAFNCTGGGVKVVRPASLENPRRTRHRGAFQIRCKNSQPAIPELRGNPSRHSRVTMATPPGVGEAGAIASRLLAPPLKSGFRRSCKPISVCPVAGGENHLSERPYPEPAALARDAERAAPRFPIWSCTGWGFPCRRACAWRGGLLPHLFTLTV
jgi:hypothetical protein